MPYNLVALSGSLRKDSYNSALIRAWKALAPDDVTVDIVSADDIRAFPLFDQDMEAAFPANVTNMKDRLKAADGILVATPEYNRSIPGVLKNFIDWTSRPYGDNAWAHTPVYVMGATGGAVGTAVAQAALRQALSYLDTHVLGQPEFYLGGAAEKFDAQGTLTDETTKEHISRAYAAFLPFVDMLR